MRSKDLKEGHLGHMADRVEQDHEVQMARAQLYKLAKYSIKLHEMLKSVSEEQGLMGWQQAKITKASDYISSVYHDMDYEMKFESGMVEGVEMCPEECCGKPVTECKCGPECPHCDCYSKNNAMKESAVFEGKEKAVCKDCGDEFGHPKSDCKNDCNDPTLDCWVKESEYKKMCEGKSPHKKGTKKYKKHMAAMHAGMNEYKNELSNMLERTLTKGESKKKKSM